MAGRSAPTVAEEFEAETVVYIAEVVRKIVAATAIVAAVTVARIG